MMLVLNRIFYFVLKTQIELEKNVRFWLKNAALKVNPQFRMKCNKPGNTNWKGWQSTVNHHWTWAVNISSSCICSLSLSLSYSFSRVIMLSFIVLSFIVLSVIKLNVPILSVIILNMIMLSVIMMSVIYASRHYI